VSLSFEVLFRRWQRLAPRKRWAMVLAVPVVAVGSWLPIAAHGSASSTPLVVQRQDLVETVEVEGDLAAVHSTEVGPPPVSEVEFKISFMAPEGTTVKKGDPILGFDTEVLQRNLAEKEAEMNEAAANVTRKEADLRLSLLTLDQQIAQVVADLGKARLKADVPPDVQQRIEFEKAQLDVRGRERDLENLRRESDATKSSAEAELGSLREQRDRARGRVAELRAAIQKMMVRATQDGIVIYRPNWRDEKKKIGDSVWSAETVLSIPDLSAMRADGFVAEADGGAVAVGQPAVVHLEARPDMDLRGHVRRIAQTVRQRSWRTPGKGFKVEIALDRTDPLIMRPAMRFRGEIETARRTGLVVVSKDAVFLRDKGPVVWLDGRFGWRERPVLLGRSNRRLVEVLEGLSVGDRVSPIDLAATEKTRPGSGSGGPS
jgi:Barrel-sandwich domain of CusB or HlyD membrane-fusion